MASEGAKLPPLGPGVEKGVPGVAGSGLEVTAATPQMTSMRTQPINASAVVCKSKKVPAVFSDQNVLAVSTVLIP